MTDRPHLISARWFAERCTEDGVRRCSKSQARHLMDAGGLGVGYQLGDQVVYDRPRAEELLAAPVLRADDLADRLEHPFAIVLRQMPRMAALPGDGSRGWFGVDLGAPDVEQRAASGRWWPLSAATRAELEQQWADHGPVPLLVCVGGMVVGGYDVVGFDAEMMDRWDRRHAFALDPGTPRWVERLRWSWLPTGPGRPLLMWREGAGL